MEEDVTTRKQGENPTQSTVFTVGDMAIGALIDLVYPSVLDVVPEVASFPEGMRAAGVSRKLANMSAAKLMELAANAPLVLAGASNPYLVPCALVSVALTVRSMSTVTISRDEGSVMLTAHLVSKGNQIREVELWQRTNTERAKHGLAALTDTEFETCLCRLAELSCISRSLGWSRLTEDVKE
jgi:hypothetical protein